MTGQQFRLAANRPVTMAHPAILEQCVRRAGRGPVRGIGCVLEVGKTEERRAADGWYAAELPGCMP